MQEKGCLLSVRYSEQTLHEILGVAIEQGWRIAFINKLTNKMQQLTTVQLLELRKANHVEIVIGARPQYPIRNYLDGSVNGYTTGASPTQLVDRLDLIVDEISLKQISGQYGDADRVGLLQQGKWKIQGLSISKLELRKKEIVANPAIEKRIESIVARGHEIYKELRKVYPDDKINEDDVAHLLCEEESPIYASLNLKPRKMATYLKHIKKPV